MNIQEIEIDKLIPYHNNPRKNQAVNKVASSLKEYGFQQPIVTDKDLVLIVGHTRLLAAKKLGLSKVPVLVADLSEAKAKAYRIADNRLNEDSEWDVDLLTLEISDLLEQNYELDLLGFDANELDKFLEKEQEYLTDEDEVPPEPEKVTSVLGDVWLLGNHRVMCGDSTSLDAIDVLLDGENKIDLLTDPPYGINAEKMTLGTGKKQFYRGSWDNQIPNFYNLLPMFNKIILWGANYYCDKLSINNDWLCWHKKNDGLSFSEFELAWTNLGKNCRIISHHWSGEKKNHPTQKPLKVIEWCVNFLDKNIIDIFGGSGSTLIACEKTNRKCYMMELDPKYVDVIIQRWQDFTGKKAIHEQTNKTFDEMKKPH